MILTKENRLSFYLLESPYLRKMPNNRECFRICVNFILKNPDFILVHGVVNSLDRSEMPYAWVKKDNKVYDVENDRWFEINEWSNQAVEQKTYAYHEVERLAEYTGHAGPWSKEEYELSSANLSR